MSVVKALLSAQVDGLIVSVSRTTIKMDHFDLFLRKGIPLVFFDRLPDGIESNSVAVDDYKGAYMIVEHLIEQGFKRIAHFSGPLHVNVSKNRMRGYKDALEKYNIPYDPALLFEAGFERRHGVEAAERLIAEGNLPDAIFAVCDPVAIGLMLTLKSQGLRIPEDIAVAGFNDEPIATIIDPPLTTIVQPAFDMGVSAANIFLQKIGLGAGEGFIKKIHNTILTIRASSSKKQP